jgi:hypothetical protein
MTFFWVVAPCSLVRVYRRFRGACCPDDGGTSTCDKSANFYHTTRRNDPADSHFHKRRRENLKAQLKY